MKFSISIAGALALAAALAAPAQENYSTWGQNRTITLNTSASGANVAANVTGFPVLVRLTAAESTIFAQAKPAGADIRFAKANGTTPLRYQIERWDATARRAEIWVRVDTVYGNNSTQNIRMYWANSGAADSSKGAAVFDTTLGFQGVYHLNDANDSAARDATLNNYRATAGNTSGTNPASINGAIGIGKSLNSNLGSNSTGAYYTIANTNTAAPKLNFNPNGGSYTLSAWVKAHSLPNAAGNPPRMGVIAKYGTASNQQYAMIGVGNGGEPNTRWSGNHRSTAGEAWSEAAATVGVWQHVVVVRAGEGVGSTQTTATIYVDGQLAALTPSGNTTATGNGLDGDLVFGAYSNLQRFLDGDVDEITLSSAARSADWIKLAYENQKAIHTLTNIGAFVPSAPAAPTAVTGVRGNAQVTVSWTAPLDNGGAAISAYKVTAVTDTNKTCSTNGTTFTCVVSGLTNGTPYTFQVRATNSAGGGVRSLASAAVTPQPPTAPSAPQSVVAQAGGQGTGQATVGWQAPANNGDSPITLYKAVAVSDTMKSCTTTGTLSCSITGLVMGTPYTFTVKATNAVGTSVASAPSNAITPPVSIARGMVFRVAGNGNAYAFELPASVTEQTERVTLTIVDAFGRSVWSSTIEPSATGAREVSWNGKTSKGQAVSAGMYVARFSIVSGGKTSNLFEQAVTLKP